MLKAEDNTDSKPASLIIVGNLPEKTKYTFGNSLRGAKIKFGNICEIKRIVILETEESMQSTDERNHVIRSVLGSLCTIISVPCTDDFRVRAFQTIADELRRRDIAHLIVDITNGRRNETFDLIIATSICRIKNVIMTTVPREDFSTPYDEIDENKYSIATIRPFSQDQALEAAAQFELIYYTDRIHELIKGIRELQSDFISGYANAIDKSLTNAIMNYFSEDPENLDNALKRLSELHEGIAKRLSREISQGQSQSRFFDVVKRIKDDLSEPARIAAAEENTVDEDRLAAVMLGETFDFCRNFRNYVAHPYHRKIGRSEVRLMIFATFTILEQIAAVAAWLEKTREP